MFTKCFETNVLKCLEVTHFFLYGVDQGAVKYYFYGSLVSTHGKKHFLSLCFCAFGENSEWTRICSKRTFCSWFLAGLALSAFHLILSTAPDLAFRALIGASSVVVVYRVVFNTGTCFRFARSLRCARAHDYMYRFVVDGVICCPKLAGGCARSRVNYLDF